MLTAVVVQPWLMTIVSPRSGGLLRKWWPLVAICLGTFMLLIDVTIVNVTLPSIASSLGASFTSLQWVIDSYALALAALLMVSGSIADRLGRRRVYLVGLVVFALASLACGVAPNSAFLVAARGVQGIGGAAMFATTTALIVTSYSGRDRGVAFGVWGATSGAAAAAGPLLGGLLTQSISWRAIFLVNLPVAVVTIVATLRVVAESKDPSPHRIDVLGAATFTLAAAALVYGLIEGGRDGWTSTSALVSFLIAVLAAVAFVRTERRNPDPMLDVRLFTRPSFAALMLAAVLTSGASFAHLAYVSIWLQSVRGLGPIQAGLVFLPLSLASFVVSAAIGRHLQGIPPQLPIGGGLLVDGAGLLLLTLVGPGSSWPALMPGLALIGVGVGLALPVLTSATFAAVPPERAGMAGGSVNTFRQLGQAVGIAVLGTVFGSRIGDVVHASPVASATAQGGRISAALAGGGYSAVLHRVPEQYRAAFADVAYRAFASGLDRIFVLSGVAALVGGVTVLLVVRPAPQPSLRSSQPAAEADGSGEERLRSEDAPAPAG